MHILDDSEIEKTVVERDPVLPDPQNAPSPARPLIGRTRLCSGLVVDAVGAGGTASVYKVWNERLELFRAVKMLSSDTPRARFETEAKITAKLRHPFIVEVYSVGEWNGAPYMEMEYVDGGSLQEALEARGRFPDAVCCAAGLCIATALDYAHTLKFTLGGSSYDGIIHRDLKPANILVSKRSEIKLSDFGIARPAQTGLHTIDGNIVGTLHYLSPEQLGGGKIDPRSDIYSFGAILYEMTTGVKTFPQKSITELTMHRAANSFKPPSEYDAPVPAAISNIILKCLKASADERYRNTAELIRDLRKAYAETAPKSVPQKTLCKFFYGDTENAGITSAVLINVDVNADAVDTDVSVDVNADDNTGVNTNVDTNISTDINVDVNTDVNTSVDTNISTDIINTDINTDINTNVNATVNTNVNPVKPSFKFPTVKLPKVKWPLTKKTTVYAAAALIAVLVTSCLTIRLMPRPSAKKDNKPSAATATFFSATVDTDTQNIAATGASEPAPATPVNNTRLSKAVNTADADTVNIVDTADVSAAVADAVNIDTAAVGVNTVSVNTIDNNTADVNTKTAHPAPSAPPVTESALLKSAAEAIDKKEWDRAIRILEKSAAFTERRGERHLMLLEACVESRQLDKAKTVLDSAARTNDALYFLTAGRYYFYRGDRPAALTALEASLTRPSALRSRNSVIGDALFYIAIVKSDSFKASPAETTRKQALDAWKRVKSAYESKPETQQFKRAEEEILELY